MQMYCPLPERTYFCVLCSWEFFHHKGSSFLNSRCGFLFYCMFLKEEICFIFSDNSYDCCQCQSFKKSLLHNIFMSKYLVNNCSGDTRLSPDFWPLIQALQVS